MHVRCNLRPGQAGPTSWRVGFAGAPRYAHATCAIIHPKDTRESRINPRENGERNDFIASMLTLLPWTELVDLLQQRQKSQERSRKHTKTPPILGHRTHCTDRILRRCNLDLGHSRRHRTRCLQALIAISSRLRSRYC